MTQVYGHMPFSILSLFTFVSTTWILISNLNKVEYERRISFFAMIIWFYLNSAFLLAVHYDLFEDYQLLLFGLVQLVGIVLLLVGRIVFKKRKKEKIIIEDQ